jgi:hypothetical protein
MENGSVAGYSRYGASETRTRDLLGAIQALSQLSYSPVRPGDTPGRGSASVVARSRAGSEGLRAGAVWFAGAWDCSTTPSASTWS